MELRDLIVDKFYCVEVNIPINEKIYFKFKCIKNSFLYNYAYQVICENNSYIYEEYDEYEFDHISWFLDKNLYQIDISLIVDYLPKENIDKRNYIRQQKIKTLLEL